MKSLKPQNVAVEDNKKLNLTEADTQNAQRFQPSALLPNMPQRILSAHVLKLQHMIGNKAVQRLLTPRMTNNPMIQREPKAVGGNEYYDIGTNTDGILTLTITNPEFVNAVITDISVLDGDSSKIGIKPKHTQIDNNGDSVTITINLNKTKMNEADKKTTVTVMFKVGGGGSSESDGEQKGDDISNSNASEAFPPAKTQDDFITEEEYRDYLIKEILARGEKKEKDGVWRTQPYNFKKKLLQPLSTSDLVDLLTITTESSDYKKAENFAANSAEAE